MTTKKEAIQEKLNNTALIIKKYNIGDQEYFFDKFSNVEKSQVIIAWEKAERKIQNKDIVKDASTITEEEQDKVNLGLKKFAYVPYRLFGFLSETFDEKKLRLLEENVERRLRRTIAERYLELISEEIIISDQKRRNPVKFHINYIRKNSRPVMVGFLYITVIISLFSVKRIKDGITSPKILTERIHEKSKYQYRIGAICNDGWKSQATGRGACSHHGGVSDWIYKTDFKKSIQECKKEADEISWLD